MRTDLGMQAARRPRPSRQHGQALLETIVACCALLTLLVGIVAIGRLMDVRHASIGAARGLAFECAVRPAECARRDATLADETRHRHFTRDDREVLSVAAVSDAPLLRSEGRPGWTDRTGRPLLDPLGAVGADTPPRRLDAPVSRIGAGSGSALPHGMARILDVAGPSRFGLALDGGLHAAQVRARVRSSDLQARFGLGSASTRDTVALPPTLQLSARTAILVDAWAASGPDGGRADSVQARAANGARLPGPVSAEAAFDAGYAGVRVLMRAADLLSLEPRASQFNSRVLQVEVVPSDRRP